MARRPWLRSSLAEAPATAEPGAEPERSVSCHMAGLLRDPGILEGPPPLLVSASGTSQRSPCLEPPLVLQGALKGHVWGCSQSSVVWKVSYGRIDPPLSAVAACSPRTRETWSRSHRSPFTAAAAHNCPISSSRDDMLPS